MKVIVTKDFYDMKVFCGRRAGDVIEVPEDRAAGLIVMRFAKAKGVEPEKAEEPKAEGVKPEKAEAQKAKPAAKKTAKKP